MTVIPAVAAVRLTGARNRTELPLLVLGPSHGTSVTSLWGDAAAHLTDVFDVLAWDLPGQGHNRSVPDGRFSMAELAAGVLRVVDDVLTGRGDVGAPFFYAGAAVGGAVGLQLMVDAPERVTAAVLLGTTARIAALGGAGLEAFDVRDRLAEIDAPVLAVAGAGDAETPVGEVREIADGVEDGRLVVLEGVAQLAPAEAPGTVARLIREHLLGEVGPDVHDDRSAVLDARSRSLARLAVMLDRRPEEELADELRRGLADGLTSTEIDELRLLVEELT